jgi:hypothetical protein
MLSKDRQKNLLVCMKTILPRKQLGNNSRIISIKTYFLPEVQNSRNNNKDIPGASMGE